MLEPQKESKKANNTKKRHENKNQKKNKKNKNKKKRKKNRHTKRITEKHEEATRTKPACEGAANTYALQCASLSTGAHGMACRLAVFATRNPFELLCLMDTHDAGAAVSAAAQCASTHTPPAAALAKARKRTAAASKPEEVSSAELSPSARRHGSVFCDRLLH